MAGRLPEPRAALVKLRDVESELARIVRDTRPGPDVRRFRAGEGNEALATLVVFRQSAGGGLSWRSLASGLIRRATDARDRLVRRPTWGVTRPAAGTLAAAQRARDRRLASGPRSQRQPDRPPLRGHPADGLPLAVPLRSVPPRDPRGPQLRPRRRRRPTWTLEQLGAVRRIRGRYPRWGKKKLAVLLKREGLVLSSSRIGRILAELVGGDLLEPPAGGSPPETRPRDPTPCASRRTGRSATRRSGRTRHPGRAPLPGRAFKQFTARDVVCRWDVVEVHDAPPPRPRPPSWICWPRMPFPVRALRSIRSEFMAEFEAACAQRGIPLFTLPPRSPKLNGASNGPTAPTPRSSTKSPTHPPSSTPWARPCAAWELVYNTVRPHQALGYLTPAEYLARFGVRCSGRLDTYGLDTTPDRPYPRARELVVAIVHSEDAGTLVDGLLAREYRATRLNSSGGFLKQSNATIIVGGEGPDRGGARDHRADLPPDADRRPDAADHGAGRVFMPTRSRSRWRRDCVRPAGGAVRTAADWPDLVDVGIFRDYSSPAGRLEVLLLRQAAADPGSGSGIAQAWQRDSRGTCASSAGDQLRFHRHGEERPCSTSTRSTSSTTSTSTRW